MTKLNCDDKTLLRPCAHEHPRSLRTNFVHWPIVLEWHAAKWQSLSPISSTEPAHRDKAGGRGFYGELSGALAFCKKQFPHLAFFSPLCLWLVTCAASVHRRCVTSRHVTSLLLLLLPLSHAFLLGFSFISCGSRSRYLVVRTTLLLLLHSGCPSSAAWLKLVGRDVVEATVCSGTPGQLRWSLSQATQDYWQHVYWAMHMSWWAQQQETLFFFGNPRRITL